MSNNYTSPLIDQKKGCTVLHRLFPSRHTPKKKDDALRIMLSVCIHKVRFYKRCFIKIADKVNKVFVLEISLIINSTVLNAIPFFIKRVFVTIWQLGEKRLLSWLLLM